MSANLQASGLELWQRANRIRLQLKLDDNGKIDAAFFDALDVHFGLPPALSVAPPVGYFSPDDLARGMLALAKKYHGLEEVENNRSWRMPEGSRLGERLLIDDMKSAMARVGWRPGYPYCASFTGALVILVLDASGYSEAADRFAKQWTSHCMANFDKWSRLAVAHGLRIPLLNPIPGSIWLARWGRTDKGHSGLVRSSADGEMALSEGNTSESNDPALQREAYGLGDGFFGKKRNVLMNGSLKTEMFIPPTLIHAVAFSA